MKILTAQEFADHGQFQSMTSPITGKSTEVRRKRDWSKMNEVWPKVARFLPCATTATLGS